VAFAVLLHPKALKELETIEKTVKSKIKENLKELKYRPEEAGKRLKYSDFWSMRVGDYRVICEIHRDKKQVLIIFIGHRNKVCESFSLMF
jgi:mRNA interferase RelE/StbE